MIRFLHTADWQLGMTRHFFSEGVQESYAQSRFDAIRRLGEIAKAEECAFILVCGDTFESNLVDRRTVARTCEALRDVPVPVYILPANHDPLNAASVYHSSTFIEQKPEHVTVIEDFTPVALADEGGISIAAELVAAPWKSKRPAINPLHELLDLLAPADGVIRIVAGHGIIDLFTPDKDAPSILELDTLQGAIQQNKAHFIALGDRHSATQLEDSDRIWYSGTPVSTDYREDNSGKALIVELDPDRVSVKEVTVTDWQFIEKERIDLNHAEDVTSLDQELQAIDNKERTVVKVRLHGGLTLSLHAQLHDVLEKAKDLFAGFEIRDRDLVMIPDDSDFAELGFSGFADKTLDRLRAQIDAEGSDAEVARDALMLLVRLAKGAQ